MLICWRYLKPVCHYCLCLMLHDQMSTITAQNMHWQSVSNNATSVRVVLMQHVSPKVSWWLVIIIAPSPKGSEDLLHIVNLLHFVISSLCDATKDADTTLSCHTRPCSQVRTIFFSFCTYVRALFREISMLSMEIFFNFWKLEINEK